MVTHQLYKQDLKIGYGDDLDSTSVYLGQDPIFFLLLDICMAFVYYELYL
jgi:hypothetical protein